MNLHTVLDRLFGEPGEWLTGQERAKIVGNYAVTQVYIPTDKGFDSMIWAVGPQVMAGHPVLMWRDDGYLVFVAGDPNRQLIDAAWRRELVKALMRWLGDMTSEE